MTSEFKTLDQLLQDGSLDQIIAEATRPLNAIVQALDGITLSSQGAGGDLVMVQTVIGAIALIIIGITFLFGSIYFLVHHRHRLATFFLALGFLGKLYPAILLPLYLQACFVHSIFSSDHVMGLSVPNSII